MNKFHEELVDTFKPIVQIHGYLLSLEIELAKTATSLMLKAELGKLHVIVVCQYSTLSSV